MRPRPANSNRKQHGRPIKHRARLIRAPKRRHVVIRKRIPPMVKIDIMHDPRIMVRDPLLVVVVIRIRLQRIAQQRAAVERRGEPRRDGTHFDVRAENKGARAAAEDVGGGGFSKGAARAGEREGVVLDGAGHGAPLGLGVDREGLVGVFGVDLVDVGLVVAVEEAIVEHDGVVWA